MQIFLRRNSNRPFRFVPRSLALLRWMAKSLSWMTKHISLMIHFRLLISDVFEAHFERLTTVTVLQKKHVENLLRFSPGWKLKMIGGLFPLLLCLVCVGKVVSDSECPQDFLYDSISNKCIPHPNIGSGFSDLNSFLILTMQTFTPPPFFSVIFVNLLISKRRPDIWINK